MTVEGFAIKHIEKAKKKRFWMNGINLYIQVVHEFVQLTNVKG